MSVQEEVFLPGIVIETTELKSVGMVPRDAEIGRPEHTSAMRTPQDITPDDKDARDTLEKSAVTRLNRDLSGSIGQTLMEGRAGWPERKGQGSAQKNAPEI